MMLGYSTAVFIAGLLLGGAALVWAAFSDARRFIIPNRASLLMLGGYLLALPHLGQETWLMGLGVGVLVLAGGVVLFALKLVGGGDVKLAVAIGFWAGPAFFGEFLFLVSIASIVLAISMLTTPLPRLFGTCAFAPGAGTFRQPMPFALPLATGGLWVLGLHLASVAGSSW